MKLFLLFAIAFPHILGQPPPTPKDKTFVIHTLVDQSVITVHEDGSVTTEAYENLPTQHWTVLDHPTEPEQLQLKNDIVPNNELSGSETEGIKEWSLNYAGNAEDAPYWEVRVLNRWCILGFGAGQPLDRDDCEADLYPQHWWRFEEVA